MPLTAANDTQLDVVDENDKIVGQASRVDIHAQGLLHREVHVWFVTPDQKVIFQKRTPKKDTFPGLLDATAGGHVELGQTYEQAALCEVAEETGLNLTASDLNYIGKYRGQAVDHVTGSTNNVQRAVYAYKFAGAAEQLAIEDEAGAGFVAIPAHSLTQANATVRAQLIPAILEPDYKVFLDQAINLFGHAESMDTDR